MLKFKPENKDQLMLLPPSVEDFIPEGHLSKVAYAIFSRCWCFSPTANVVLLYNLNAIVKPNPCFMYSG